MPVLPGGFVSYTDQREQLRTDGTLKQQHFFLILQAEGEILFPTCKERWYNNQGIPAKRALYLRMPASG